MHCGNIVCCNQCQEPIETPDYFVRFKTPGQQGYAFFHHRFSGSDCWERYLRDRSRAIYKNGVES